MKGNSNRALEHRCGSFAEYGSPFDDSASSEVLARVPTVLVIESDAILRNLLRDILSRNGYVVLDAVHIKEAGLLLQSLPAQHVDLLIAEGGVCDLAALEREVLSARPAVKVLMTVHSDGAGPIDPPDLTGIPVLHEPFTEPRLLEQIAVLLNPKLQ
jgi:DNA-binding NtrC family response regulator